MASRVLALRHQKHPKGGIGRSEGWTHCQCISSAIWSAFSSPLILSQELGALEIPVMKVDPFRCSEDHIEELSGPFLASALLQRP